MQTSCKLCVLRLEYISLAVFISQVLGGYSLKPRLPVIEFSS